MKQREGSVLPRPAREYEDPEHGVRTGLAQRPLIAPSRVRSQDLRDADTRLVCLWVYSLREK
jgi:hypothetical protein